MITVLVILWYGNGNQIDADVEVKNLVINGFVQKYTEIYIGSV